MDGTAGRRISTPLGENQLQNKNLWKGYASLLFTQTSSGLFFGKNNKGEIKMFDEDVDYNWLKENAPNMYKSLIHLIYKGLWPCSSNWRERCTVTAEDLRVQVPSGPPKNNRI